MLRRLVLAVVVPLASMLLVPTLVLVATGVVAMKLGLVQTYVIPSSSMEPTLHCGRPAPGCVGRVSDRVLAVAHWPGGYGRGDIVAFRAPRRALARCGAAGTFVKRIVGLPGDRVEVRLSHGAGFVFVNGRRLPESYVAPGRRRPAARFEPVRVQSDRYFVLGDNRARSCDSREWGTVSSGDILGKVVLSYWPLTRIGHR